MAKTELAGPSSQPVPSKLMCPAAILNIIFYLSINLSHRGEQIKELKGCIAVMTAEQQRNILVEGINDYSVQYSTIKRQSQLWLGPASFLNHGKSESVVFCVKIVLQAYDEKNS